MCGYGEPGGDSGEHLAGRLSVALHQSELSSALAEAARQRPIPSPALQLPALSPDEAENRNWRDAGPAGLSLTRRSFLPRRCGLVRSGVQGEGLRLW